MNKPRLGIIGAGKLGVTLAQLAIRAGYTVSISGSGSADKITLSMRILAPGAVALETSEVIKGSDVIILALPLREYESLPSEQLAGKVIIDAMNYWWETDGSDPKIAAPSDSTSQLVQRHLTNSRVTKALSHVGYHDLRDFAAKPGEPARIAIAFAGPAEDRLIIESITHDLGFASHYLGELGSGKKLEPGGPVFGAHLPLNELVDTLA